MKTCVHSNTCPQTSVAALLIIAPNEDNPEVFQQVSRLWYIRAVEYYLAIKRNGPLVHVTTQMNP